jgi:hypothetical protein
MKLILASAGWCGPCKIIKSRLVAENLIDKVEIKDADVDSHVAFFKANNIKSVPRLVVMDGENVVELIQGTEDIIERIKKG